MDKIVAASQIGSVDIKFSDSECCYRSKGRCLVEELGSIDRVEKYVEKVFEEYPGYGLPINDSNFERPDFRNDYYYCPVLAYRWFVMNEDVIMDPEISLNRSTYTFNNGRHRYCIAEKLGLLDHLMVNIVN